MAAAQAMEDDAMVAGRHRSNVPSESQSVLFAFCALLFGHEEIANTRVERVRSY